MVQLPRILFTPEFGTANSLALAVILGGRRQTTGAMILFGDAQMPWYYGVLRPMIQLPRCNVLFESIKLEVVLPFSVWKNTLYSFHLVNYILLFNNGCVYPTRRRPRGDC